RPLLRLEDVLQRAVGVVERVPLEALRGAVRVGVDVVDAQDFRHPVDRLRARRRGRRALDAEALSGLVELQVVVHRLAGARAVQVAYAVLFARVELNAVAVRAALRLDRDDAVRRGRSIERRASRALDDLDRLDVESTELAEVADVHDDAVDDDERVAAPAGQVDRRRAAEHDVRRGPGLSAGRGDTHAGDLALE